ncbi:MAG: nitrate reductase subunit beta [bacterium]
MKIKAQLAMVMNLDKCIGCHTCSIPCKNVWTSRPGAEYIWFNNVETKPGIGYPKHWEDQERYRGGWAMKDGKLDLAAGGRLRKLAGIFYNPDLPTIDDYYEPWTYDYEKLTSSPASKQQPAIRPKSLITGRKMELDWGPNWEDDLAGAPATGGQDVNFRSLEAARYLQFEEVFMFYLPRICEHCLNPSCVASCPSAALYKRDEDGIVLVDQVRCRGWRFCVSGCPYKKVYFQWASGTSVKCLFCYPRIEAGLTTLCAETCVGRIRSVGALLYDADRVREAASVAEDTRVYPAHLSVILDPDDPEVARRAAADGIPEATLAAARNSPVYQLAVRWRLALPPHPEFRTLPMVWYIPPLSPIARVEDPGATEGGIDDMRIPVRYLANLLAAGDEEPVRLALNRLLAIRRYMRSVRVEKKPDKTVLEEAGLDPSQAEEMVRLLAIAKFADRYVIPTARREADTDPGRLQGRAGYPEDA